MFRLRWYLLMFTWPRYSCRHRSRRLGLPCLRERTYDGWCGLHARIIYPPGNYSPLGRGSDDVNLAITKNDETILGDPRRHPVRYHADHCEREQRVLALADCDDPACQRYAAFNRTPVTGGPDRDAKPPAGERPQE